MSNSTPQNTATTFVAQSLEDAVKAGIASGGLDGVGVATNVLHNPVTVAIAFAGGFIASLVLSFISQPFGNKATNHIFGQIEVYSQELTQAVLNDLGNVPAKAAPYAGVEALFPVADQPDSNTIPTASQPNIATATPITASPVVGVTPSDRAPLN